MMNKDLIQKHLHALTESKKLWIAYSGGLDSHVLLHSLADYPANIQAIHVHHGLNPQADQWAEHCLDICQQLNIPLIVEKIHLESSSRNVEAKAREKRYEIFFRHLGENEVLLTAHHQNDQAETLLLQLFRGAGLKGLSSMPHNLPFAKGTLIRPLLSFSQAELREYAEQHNLHWIKDSSNQDLHFHRNFIRHELLPFIQTRWPSIHKTLARSAGHMADAQTLLENSAQTDLECILEDQTLSIPKLLKLSSLRQQNVLRYWLASKKLPLPSTHKLSSIQKDVLLCKPDATPLVQWGHVQIRRYRDKLYAIDSKNIYKTKDCEWNLKDELILPQCDEPLTRKRLIAHGVEVSGIEKLKIKFREGGERCKLKDHLHSKSLKKIFQEWGIPPWERKHIPLIYHGEELIAIWGYTLA